jgi:7-carboxy-7-deazaguanine synthase
MPHIFVSPVFGTLPNETIVDWMLDSEGMTRNGARFQVQLHKIVWDPECRGV